jgi:hypothetical protein
MSRVLLLDDPAPARAGEVAISCRDDAVEKIVDRKNSYSMLNCSRVVNLRGKKDASTSLPRPKGSGNRVQ